MRRNIGFLVSGIFLATLVAGIWAPSPAVAGPIELTYACFPPAQTFPCVQMERWKKEVEKRTGGKVAIKTFPGGTLLGGKNMFDGVIAGVADIGNLVTAYQPGRFIVTNATSLPFNFPDATVASLVLWDFYLKYKPKEFDKVKVLTAFANPPSNIMSKRPIKTLADIKNYNLRASGGAAQILKAWGANPVGMPMPATVEALQKGVVQGLFSSLEVMKDFKFAETCRYVTMTNTVIYPFVTVMNKSKWDSLPKEVQKVFDDLAAEHSWWTGNYNDNHWRDAMAWSKKTYNVEVINLSGAELAKWNKLLEPITQQWIEKANAKGLPGNQIVKDIKALAKKHSK